MGTFSADDYAMKFVVRLNELMKEKAETQNELAKVVDKQRQTVSLYLSGKSKPDYETVKKISEHFHVSSDWLIGIPGSTRESTSSNKSELAVDSFSSVTGLSKKAVSAIIENQSHINALNLLLESKELSKALRLIDDGITRSSRAKLGFSNTAWSFSNNKGELDSKERINNKDYIEFKIMKAFDYLHRSLVHNLVRYSRRNSSN